ncbi:MAG: enoyl-CoA hydratase/isomerase family protein, partial [Actinomycetota bacterium]
MTETRPHPHIRVDRGGDRGGDVVTVTIDRPERKNACTGDMWVHLGEVFTRVGYSGARVVVLTGAGDDFCAGADLVARNAPGGHRPRAGSIQRRLPVQVNRLMTLLC